MPVKCTKHRAPIFIFQNNCFTQNISVFLFSSHFIHDRPYSTILKHEQIVKSISSDIPIHIQHADQQYDTRFDKRFSQKKDIFFCTV